MMPNKVSVIPYAALDHRVQRQESFFNCNNVSLDLAVDGSCSEFSGDGICRDVGRFAEQQRVAIFDFISQWRPLAVSDRRDSG
jgi:hypothetical protein